MLGFDSISANPFSAVPSTAAPVPIVVIDTHDGGDKLQKRFKKETETRDRRKQQIQDLYEELVELKPQTAAEIVAPFVPNAVKGTKAQFDFDAFLKTLDRTEALYGALQRELAEIDDEDVLLLL
jgi:hypothetical protein